MQIPWNEDVKSSKKLFIYNGIAAGKWATVFNTALEKFNALKLGVTAKRSNDKESANVVMQLSDGSASFKHDKKDYNESFNANKLHGYTMLLHRDGVMEKAAVFLPIAPKIFAGFNDRGGELYENVTVTQMLVVAVHELIHACGLDNDEHDDDGVFQKGLVPMSGKVGSIIRTKQSKMMPPIYISEQTKSKILTNWS